MPDKVRRLKEEAIRSCKFREHTMSRFVKYVRGGHHSPPTHYISFCCNCGMAAIVRPNPWPNEIDIGGEAVALNCSKFKETP